MKHTLILIITLSFGFGQSLNQNEKEIQKFVEKNTNEAIDLLEKIVNINSGSLNIKGNQKVGKILQKDLDKLGFNTYWVTYPKEVKRSGHLFAEMRGGKGKKITMVGHLDTVFEKDHPFQNFLRQGNKAYGPGVDDNKSGIVSMLYVMKALDHIGKLKDMNLTLVFIGDEEKLGAHSSIVRKELIDAGKWADIGLGFEGATGIETGTIARRSASSWILTTTGIQGHSSQVFSETLGYGAIFEASRIINSFREKLAEEEYLTFNPGVIVGGTDTNYDPVNAKGIAFGKTNVVSQSVTVHGGIRTISIKQLEDAIKSMEKIASNNLPGTTAKIEFKTSYPPMEPTKANYALLDKLEEVNLALGYGNLEPLDPSKRGAADISFIAPYVDAALAGMGPDGQGAHSADEWLDLTSFPKTTTRSAILIYRLTK
ncbi:MAG: M20/M25/M40 family metallo-hydrolase [Candidatus Marinimicrobia bacterium]|jgi:glutamate carboxypeptidase|nr:M20/M25/M40 family metallo-hydrolase [Candidatus Neomarinimicrobiota bacterium]|tara:strand:+ start:1570 stop:2850 length:1281 start_codon:yes stop_codon:yes gene_type:complete